MDGLEFVKQLQQQNIAANTPVVMITTEGSESNVMQALSCGARGYIRKPFTPEEFAITSYRWWRVEVIM